MKNVNVLTLKLGKGTAAKDSRTLMLSSILTTELPPIPEVYDFDRGRSKIPTPMFKNDVHGDCVIAGRAHQTIRFERMEQRKTLNISDADVVDEYFRQTKGADSGLIVLRSLKQWRNEGWTAAGNRYTIAAFAKLKHLDRGDVRASIFLLSGLGCGILLPLTAQAQFAAGKPWDVVPDAPDGQGNRGSWGGHYVYCHAYNKTGPVCVTWGRKQQITWAFWDKYCDEAYGIVDGLNKWRAGKPGIDVARLEKLLADIQR